MKPALLGLLAASALLSPSSPGSRIAHAQTGAPLPGVVVLKSGQLLQGQIERKGDKYRVTTDTGGKVSVPTEDVDFTANDLMDAYRHQARHLDPTNLDQQIHLARWCWQAGLIAEGRRHLSEAITLDPRHPRVKHLQSQIATSFTSAGTANQALSTIPAPGEVPPPKRVLPDPKTDLAAGPVSKEIMQGFTRQIQPLLIARCSGCHVPGGGRPFALRRPAQRSLTPPALSAANLAAVRSQLALGNTDSFQEHARIAHGGSQALTAREYDQILVPWLDRLQAGSGGTTSIQRPRPAEPSLPLPTHAALNASRPAAPDPFDPSEFNAANDTTSDDPGADQPVAGRSGKPTSDAGPAAMPD